MATCRARGSKFEFIVKRKGLLPKPIYLTFDSKEEGEAYCSYLEGLLDQGIIPEEFLQSEDNGLTVRKVIIEYELTVSVTQNDKNLLGVSRERIGDLKISEVTYDWAERLIFDMKRKRNLVPGTIRHHIGALARCFDWAVKKGYMPFNPLRILPKGYAKYTEEDKKHVELKEDQERDRRLEPGEEETIRKVLMTEYKPAHKQRPLELEHRHAQMLMFELAIETAMRMREIYTLSKNQIDINNRTNLSDLQIAKITGHKNMEMLRRYANLRASDLAGQLW